MSGEAGTRRERRQRERGRRTDRSGGTGARRGIGRIWLVLGGIALLALAGFGLSQAGVISVGQIRTDQTTTETVGTKYPDEGNAHLEVGQKATYKNDPPTSGAHYSQAGVSPANWGIYDRTLPNEVILHNLEHGGIVVFYKDLTDDEKAQLTDLVRNLRSTGFNKILLEPYATMKDARIALSAWDWGLKLQSVDSVLINSFVKQHYAGPDAPEPNVP